jgi:hypothetical protein
MRSWLVAPAAALFTLGIASAMVSGCGSRSSENDPPSTPTPNAAGGGPHIADISDPGKKTHATPNDNVSVTGVVVTWVDQFDETNDGKSRGAIYVQDLESHAPFAGIGLFAPTFVPASLVVGPGDVLDLAGQYQENATLGTTVKFPKGEVLTQIAHPTGTFRFEYKSPDPTPIDWHDLLQFSTGRKWMGQLVTIKDVTLAAAVTTSSGRASAPLALSEGGAEVPTLTNELTPLDAYPQGQKFKSVTGIITYFFNLHIAPRTKADLVAE